MRNVPVTVPAENCYNEILIVSALKYKHRNVNETLIGNELNEIHREISVLKSHVILNGVLRLINVITGNTDTYTDQDG